MLKLTYHIPRLPLVAAVTSLIFSACAPLLKTEVPASTEAIDTSVALTMQAFETEAVLSATPSNTPLPPTLTPSPTSPPPLPTAIPTNTGTGVPSLTPIMTFTQQNKPSQTAVVTGTTTVTSVCNKGQFIADVTVPDGTQLTPNTPFTKVWRIRNVGTCTWDSSYRFVFISGDKMGATNIPMPQITSPGASVDIGVNFTSPNDPAFYKSNWMLQGGGEVFGGGSNGDQPFWVMIEVVDNPEYILYNFAQNYCRGEWKSGAGALPCPGKVGDPDGFVYLQSNPILETGNENEPALWTHPEWVKDGWIAGRYPTIRIQNGYRFMADIGCFGNFKKCSVTFELYYEIESDNLQLLGSWNEVNDGVITRIDLDLSFLAGQSVHFILVARVNNGPPDHAAAFWMIPQIRTP